MSEILDQAVGLLRAGIAEIDKEAAQLHRTIARLGGGSNGTQRKASRRPKRRRSTKRAKKGQRLDEVSAILKANPKAKTAEIAKQIGISTNQVSGLRKQVATSGNLKKPSQKKRNAK